jgi:hypothetical protein
MNGAIVGVYDLRIYGGLSTSNFINYALATPTFTTTPTVTAGISTNGISADVDISCVVTNVPQDGTVGSVAWFFREHLASPVGWTPWANTPLSGNPNPPASQNLSFSYTDLTNGKLYDFAMAFVGLNGVPGQLATITASTGFTAQTLSISGAYLLGSGVPATAPATTAVTLTVSGALVPGVSVIVQEQFTLTNQPTDGSLARIGLWIRNVGATTWTENGSIDVQSKGSAIGIYNVRETELANGTNWEFGVSYVGISGTESPVSSLGAITGAALAVGTTYLQAGSGVAPTISVAPTYAETPSTTGITTDLTVSFFCNNQPTDGSLAGLVFFIVSSAPTGVTQQPLSSGLNAIIQPTAGAYNYTFTGLSNSSSSHPTDGQYQIGIAYAYTNGTYGAILTFSVYTVTAVVSLPPAYLLPGAVWTPSVITNSVTNVSSVNGTNASTLVNITISSQPTDSSLNRINFWYRKTGATTWIPAGGIQSTSPAATGTYSFEYDNLTKDNSSTYDFGVSGENNAGAETTIIAFQTAWSVGAVTIPAQYMGGSGVVTPVITGASAVVVSSTNGLSSSIQITFTITNQPTDGTLSRVNLYKCLSGPYWAPDSSIPAGGVGLAYPPASATYTYTFNDLSNGASYYFALTLENGSGAESTLVQIIGPIAALTVGIPANYQLGFTAYTPTIALTSSSYTPSVNGISGAYGVNFNVTNQPTDGSLSRIVMYFKQSTQTTWTSYATIPASGVGSASPPSFASYTFVFADLQLGISYDFAVGAESTQGAETSPVTLITGVTVANAITPVQGKAIPASATVSVTGSFQVTKHSSSGVLNILATINWTIGGTTDFSWITDIQLLYVGGDPAYAGASTMVQHIPTNGNGSGTFNTAIPALFENFTYYPSFAWNFFVAVYGMKTTRIVSNSLGCTEGATGTTTTTVTP